jgi:hypothetical protein
MTNIKAKLRELSPAELEAVIGGALDRAHVGSNFAVDSTNQTTPNALLGWVQSLEGGHASSD